MNDRIAAIVPCHNRRDKTLRFLQVFLTQTYPDLDLILVDANSQDGTAQAIQSQAPETIILSVSEDCYWTAATNAGIRYALDHGYDYILTINDDCLIAPDYVDTLVKLAKKFSLLILGSRIEHLSQPGLLCGLGIFPNWVTSLFSHRYKDQWFDRLPLHVQESEILKTDGLPGNGTLIHRSVFERIGLYEERHLPHYLSDVELIIRAKRSGIQAWVTPQAIIRDDFPTPNQRVSEQSAPKITQFWAEFRYIFFHTRSGGKLSARFYIILHYCPLYLMPIAFGMCAVAVLNWILRFVLKCYCKPQQTVAAYQGVPASDGIEFK